MQPVRREQNRGKEKDGDGWKAMDRWTVRWGRGRCTVPEGRRWVATKGRGDQTWDMIRGEVQERKGSLRQSRWHQASGLAETGRRGEMGAPWDFTESLPLPLLLPWLSGRGSPTKLKSSLSSRLSVPGGGRSGEGPACPCCSPWLSLGIPWLPHWAP